MNSYLIDYYRQQRLCTSVVALTALCASFTTVLMAQPEVTSMPDNAAKVHWQETEVDVLLQHLIENRAAGGDGGNFTNTTFNSAATAINDNHAIQTIGPPKTARMVRTKWTSLKKIFNQIENYRNVSGFHWDNVRGAGIEGRAAGDVWDTYVNPNSQAVMRPFRNKGWARYDNMQLIIGDNSGARGRHALHPATAPPPSVNTADDVPDVFDGGLGLLDMDVDTAGAAAPSDVPDMSPDLMMPLSAQLHGTSATSQAAGSQSSKRMRTDTFVDSSSQRTGAPPVSNNPVPLSSTAAKIAAKITPAVAVMNMQGSINRLTDVIEKTIATPPPLPPPVPQVVVPTVPNIISRGLEIMRSKDGDFLSVGQRASLLRIFSLAGGDNKLAIYVGLEDDYETRRAFILELLDSPPLQ
ncbi:hypothetical protein DFJ58DRAFT_855793 [Suillus subalutaceus]|uniref:uncharacterized protein n=1 Tax=Suillus subalutaceus TaxID=48586 RepID=UPI001B8769E7|nr:uncharacterized protein DFJ58DRAFT_855793 [Suillus subalutaceus]KAG1869433.1 hypothetical protein DFJ58DRAFT_855793 [Suillus subalutaceus]